MNLFHFPTILALTIASVVALPLPSQAKDRTVTVLRDNDGDGHYNKKKIEVRDHRYDRGHSYDNRYYGNRYYGNRYYGSRYYGNSYGYPYRYGYGTRYYGPSLGVSYYSTPSYAYRSYGYDDDTVVDVQRELRRRGYYRGSIDGDAGPGTRSAIRSYQANRGLPVTGRIDSSLLRSLGV